MDFHVWRDVRRVVEVLGNRPPVREDVGWVAPARGGVLPGGARAQPETPGRCNQHPPEPEVRLTALRRAGGLHSQMAVDEPPFPRKFLEDWRI